MNIIIVSDIHAPYHDRKALSKFEEFLSDDTWDAYVNLGDLIDLDCISKFVEGKPGLIQNNKVINQVEEAREILQRHKEIVNQNNKKADFYFITGNHEKRMQDYMYREPSMGGILDLRELLNLDKLGFRLVNYGKTIKLDGVLYTHGLFTGLTATRKAAEVATSDIVMGHSHTIEMTPNHSLTGATRHAYTIGCLCKKNMDYLEGKGSRWSHGFATANDGMVHLYKI